MKVIVIEDVPGEYDALGQALVEAGYATRIVSVSAGPASFTAELPDVTVVGCRSGVAQLTALAAQRLSQGATGYRAIVALVDAPLAPALEVARRAGADDVVLTTATTADMLEHIASSARIVSLERRLRERVSELEGALGRVVGAGPAAVGANDKRGGLRFLLASTWTGLDEILRGMCSEYLQNTFEQITGSFVVPAGCAAASIALTDVENEVGMEITFLTKHESARLVATMFTGDASIVDDDVAKDVLLELANSGMGAIRNAFLAEDFKFSPSTPKSAPARDVDKLVAGVTAKRMVTFMHGAAVIHVIVAVRSQARIKVRGMLLKEGMVVASDILNDAGLLLVRAGTRLTETTAGRIGRMVPKLEVELADAA